MTKWHKRGDNSDKTQYTHNNIIHLWQKHTLINICILTSKGYIQKDGHPLPERTSFLRRARRLSLAVQDNYPFGQKEKK